MVNMEKHDSTTVIIDEKPELEDPIFIEGLTGIGHIGRTVVSYLIDQLEAEKFGELISHHFPHWAIVNEDKQLDILKNEFYYLERDDGRDIVMLIGDAQSLDPQGHYEVAHSILDVLDDLDVEELITIGGFGTGEVVDEPDIYGVVTKEDLKEDYEGYNISFDHSVGQIIGASGLLLGVGERYGMDGICLLSETPGFLLSDPKATEEVLKILEKMLDFDLDYDNLDEKIEEAQEVIKKIQKLQKQVQEQQHKGKSEKGGEELGYIG
ncbi:MAG: proteasome assembly chaperone family protein [Candidatus Nanohaloarchaea archaeon]|nr:proteasome assembly chaperone family protein [Candidatus Nanohaloarchaea archaeon]